MVLRRAVGPALVALVVVGALATILHESPLDLGGRPLDDFLDNWVYHAVLVLSAVACLGRAAAVRRDRAAWACIGLALGLWAAGDVYWTLVISEMKVQPYPSVADALWISGYLPFYVGLLLFVRNRVSSAPLSMWLDGAIGGLAMGAIAAAVLTPALVGLGTGDLATVATNVAYPMADVLLLLFLVGAFSVIGWRGGWEWPLIGFALLTNVVADTVYLVQIAEGTYFENTMLDGLWLVGPALFAVAAWISTKAPPLERHAYHSLTLPVVFGIAAVGVLAYQVWTPISSLGETLAVAALAAMVARLLLAFGENKRLLSVVSRESVTDALTGLNNRRQLVSDLERELGDGAASPHNTFALFDLDGFKNYNDRFGHAAGDALLARLGAKLMAAVAPGGGQAYRLGGDEFCVLLPANGERDERLADVAVALSEVGEGFVISSTFGSVELPEEAANPSDALRMADGRMYARKRGRRSSAERQTRDVLISAQLERQPELDQHMKGVARLAAQVGRRLGVDGEDLEVLTRAAELHDIGKIAIPMEVLRTPGPLDEAGWGLVRKHTLIGERILSSAPAMLPVARLVRSTHERWDGEGYPDGIRGEQITFGARIIFACDAFDAMRSDRPHSPPLSFDEAVAELRRNAGTQFDPLVVEELCALLESEMSPVLAAPPPRAPERPVDVSGR